MRIRVIELCHENGILNACVGNESSDLTTVKQSSQNLRNHGPLRNIPMTNSNQLCDVLLFLCSKMADETNLSSRLPVLDRTREV